MYFMEFKTILYFSFPFYFNFEFQSGGLVTNINKKEKISGYKYNQNEKIKLSPQSEITPPPAV